VTIAPQRVWSDASQGPVGEGIDVPDVRGRGVSQSRRLPVFHSDPLMSGLRETIVRLLLTATMCRDYFYRVKGGCLASVTPGADCYEAFPAVEARRLVERFEWHYTPKHGSWLDLAESELGVLTSQCLDRRIPNKQILIDEIAAWEHDRNANHTKADGRWDR
jgi:hypothetical protein